MGKRWFLPVLFLVGIFTNYSPYVPSYGGKIRIKNNTSYNLYIIFQTVSDTEKMLCIEKNEQIQIIHTFSGGYLKNLANPAHYYTEILFHDLDSGILLKKLTVNADLFEQINGSIDSNNALFELSINDAVLGVAL